MYLTITSFKNQFDQYGFPYWWAYNGKSCVGKFRDDEDEYEGDEKLDFSWLQLEDLFSAYPNGGRITIKLKKNLTDSSDKAITKKVQWGNPQIGNVGNSYSNRPMHAASTQMNDIQWQMMQMMMQQQNNHHQSIMEINKQNIQLQYENMNLERDLEDSAEPSMELKLIEEGIRAVKELLRPRPTIQPAAALGTLGQRDTVETTTEQPTDKRQQPKTPKFSMDQFLVDVNVLRKVFPEYSPNLVTRALAIFAQQNEQQARTLLIPMIESLKAHQKNG